MATDFPEIPPEADDFWIPLSAAKPEEPSWIIKNLLPSGLVFIGGPAKTMKTTLAVGLANIVSGHACGILPSYMAEVVLPGRVMILEAEASAGDLRYMCETDMGVKLWDDDSILVSRDYSDFRLDDPDGLSQLMKWLKQFKPRMLIIDPMVEFHDLDEKDSGDMKRLLRPVRNWAMENKSCVCIIHHTTKPGETHSGVYAPLDMRGSSALFGAANGVIMLSPTAIEGQLIIAGKFKRGASWTTTVQLGVFGQVAKEIMNKVDLQVLSSVRTGGPAAKTTQSIAATLKLSVRTVEDSLGKLRRAGYLGGA